MSRSSELTYTPAWWVPGTHLQTLWGKLFRRAPVIATRAERWPTPDDDEIEVHRLEAPPGSDRRTPRLPFLPSDICYNVAMVAQNNAFIKTEIWMEGGHVGFVSGHYLFDPHYYAEGRILEFLANEVGATS